MEYIPISSIFSLTGMHLLMRRKWKNVFLWIWILGFILLWLTKLSMQILIFFAQFTRKWLQIALPVYQWWGKPWIFIHKSTHTFSYRSLTTFTIGLINTSIDLWEIKQNALFSFIYLFIYSKSFTFSNLSCFNGFFLMHFRVVFFLLAESTFTVPLFKPNILLVFTQVVFPCAVVFRFCLFINRINIYNLIWSNFLVL